MEAVTIEPLLVVFAVFAVFTALQMFLLSRCYHRATPQMAFVRSGMGGTRVVLHGGVLAFPHLNDVTWINMAAMRFDIPCSLPFQDGDTESCVELVVRVRPDARAVLTAATAWGDKTREPSQLQPLIEANLIDALRAAAAQTSLAAANDNRGAFIRQTQAALNQSLTNGLLLESVRFESAPCE